MRRSYLSLFLSLFPTAAETRVFRLLSENRGGPDIESALGRIYRKLGSICSAVTALSRSPRKNRPADWKRSPFRDNPVKGTITVAVTANS